MFWWIPLPIGLLCVSLAFMAAATGIPNVTRDRTILVMSICGVAMFLSFLTLWIVR